MEEDAYLIQHTYVYPESGVSFKYGYASHKVISSFLFFNCVHVFRRPYPRTNSRKCVGHASKNLKSPCNIAINSFKFKLNYLSPPLWPSIFPLVLFGIKIYLINRYKKRRCNYFNPFCFATQANNQVYKPSLAKYYDIPSKLFLLKFIVLSDEQLPILLGMRPTLKQLQRNILVK
ncbi:hypothetical protein V6Z11_D11G046200 [Gossypium hirsutum]